jgi:hypothetical protein
MLDWLSAVWGLVVLLYAVTVLVAPRVWQAHLSRAEYETDRQGYRLNFPRLFRWPLESHPRRISWFLCSVVFGGFSLWVAVGHPPKEALAAFEVFSATFAVVAVVVIWRWAASELKRSR